MNGCRKRVIESPKSSNQEVLDELTRRIVRTAHPRRILLFGSAARGETTSRSDIDLLVVMPDGVHRRHTAQTLYRCLFGLGIAKDIVVVTEQDIRQHADNPSLVLWSALREGRELYHAD